METWQELKVTVKREGEELVSNLLIELGAQGVAIEDSMDYVGNVDRFGEIFPDVEQQEEIVVTAYYPETVDVAAVEADLQARLAELTDFMDLGEVKMGTTALAEEDWADNWKKYYEPARITHDLTIVPSRGARGHRISGTCISRTPHVWQASHLRKDRYPSEA